MEGLPSPSVTVRHSLVDGSAMRDGLDTSIARPVTREATRIGHTVAMARADLLVALVRSGSTGDQRAFQRAAEAIIAEETAKKHSTLAGQLTDALRATQRSNGHTALHSFHREANSSRLFHEVQPDREMASLVLPSEVKEPTAELIEEHHRRELLRSYGLEPRNRVLLVGPPGSGKTSLAEAIATSLMVPLLSVRYEGLIGSYLGETASRLDELFGAARIRPCVLFFDEFDAVAKERGDTHETGEIKRVVSSLLLQVDKLPSHVVVIAATNHQELLDRAVWRRMQLRLELPSATRSGVIELISSWQDRTGVALGLTPRTIAERLKNVSYAEVEEFIGDVYRRLVLDGPEADPRQVTSKRLTQWSNRAGVTDDRT
jgi:SpoVK/Ycf46/Vps4 family AAA+-type ATPase